MYKFVSLVKYFDNKLTLDVSSFNKFTHREYEYFLEDIWDTILNDYTIKNKRVDLFLGKKYIKTSTIAELYMQLIYWEANIKYKIPIHEIDFRITPNMITGNLHEAIEHLLSRFKTEFEKKRVDYDELASIAKNIIQRIMHFSITFSWISPDSISLYDIIQFSKRNYKFNQLIHTKLDEDMNVKEIEKRLKRLEKELIECVIDDKQNCLYPYVYTGTVNRAQLRQMFTAVGTRASIDKTVLPIPITGNFLNGLKTPAEFYAEALTARSALIDKDTFVADSGYEARKIDLNSINTTIDFDVNDCKTKHFLVLHVKDNFILNLFDKKYQILDDGSLRAIDSKNDKYLIGQTIKIRSHVYCALQNNVCKTCYGSNADIMKGTRIGCFPSIKVSSPFTNRVISSKHFTVTNSASIDNEGIRKFFTIEQNSCNLKTDIDYSNVKLTIDKLYFENLLENSNNSDSEEEYDVVPLENAILIESVLNRKTDEIVKNEYNLTDVKGMYLFLHSDLLEEKKAFRFEPNTDYVSISLDKIDISTPVFNIIVLSEGTMYYLNEFIKTIDQKCVEDICDPNEVMNKILDIFSAIDFKCKIQHVETLVSNLIKDKYDWTRRPDFRKNNVEIQILPVKKAIFYKDLYTALLFEDYLDQFKSLSFFKHTKPGIFDSFFRTNKKFVC